MNQSEEYFKALYEYQLKMEQLRKQREKEALRLLYWMFGAIVALVGLLMFFFLPDFWPWNQI